MLHELVIIATNWKIALLAATTQESTTTIAISRKLAQDKGKRKIVKNLEAKQSYKMKADPFIEKETLAIEAKKQQ